MTKKFKFDKKCNIKTLKEELIAGNFQVVGLSLCSNKLEIHLNDAESKNPETIVKNHIYIKPLTPEENDAKQKLDYANATTAVDKLNLIAKRIGLI